MPKQDNESLKYLHGLGNYHYSEALPGSLPQIQNTPQVCPMGLYAEQLSGTAFTVPRVACQKRIRPSVCHKPYEKAVTKSNIVARFGSDNPNVSATPNQLRWSPFDIPSDQVNFVEGIKTICGAGDASMKHGMAVHIYCATVDMQNCAIQNSDGDFLIVPQQGALRIQTEFGIMVVSPNEIAVVQRGIRFAVNLLDGPSRGYICEIFDGHFELPDLGPIGANGLANPKDFEFPVAAFEDKTGEFLVYNKFLGDLYQSKQDWSPFNVVAWHGNYVPFKYDLSKFCVVNSVSFDHLDPSIFTVLTCKSNTPGVAVVDFVIFPPRWAVQEKTFRPPYYHRNTMSEFMGLIFGQYEAKKEGFNPGGASLHNCMSPHGPDLATFNHGTNANLVPVRVADGTQSFMFETCFIPKVTEWALTECNKLQPDYYKAWIEIPSHFDPKISQK